jgi:hypothetical protein
MGMDPQVGQPGNRSEPSSSERARERFQFSVSQSLPPFMIGSIVAFALAPAIFSPRRPMLVHVVFALNWIAFYLIIMGLERIIPGQPGATSILSPLLVVLAVVHLVIAMRCAYGHSWPRAVASGLGLTVILNLILVAWIESVIEYAYRVAV